MPYIRCRKKESLQIDAESGRWFHDYRKYFWPRHRLRRINIYTRRRIKKSNSSNNWVNEGYTLRSATANYVIKNGLTDFSRLTISSPVNAGRLLQTGHAGKPGDQNTIAIKPVNTFIENLYPTIGNMQNIYIKTGNTGIQKMQVQLYDMQGKLILDRQLDYQ